MGTTRRTIDYGYGLSDIQEARENLLRQGTMGAYQTGKQFKDLRRSLPGVFNQRGMLDSGQYRRGRERLAGGEEMAVYGLQSQIEEARRQLDKQRGLLEDQFQVGLQEDQIANALRRFGVAQTIQGLV
jgi:hypothetical protein